MAIEPYKRSIGVDAGSRSVDFGAPGIADIGGEMSNLGAALRKNAEPILAAKAEEKGRTDAGKAPLVYDDKGRLTRAEPLPGGGVVYRENFMKAANVLYRTRILADAETDFIEIAERQRDNPQGAMAEMKAKVEALYETVPPDIRAEIEVDVTREMMQRFNGLSSEKAQRDRRQVVSELNSHMDGLIADSLASMSAAADRGDMEAFRLVASTLDRRAQENQDARRGLGELGDVGEEAEDLAIGARLAPVRDEMVSLKGMQAIVARASEYSGDAQALQLLSEWTDADPSAGKGRVIGMNRDAFVAAVPSRRVRAAVASWASGTLADLQRAEAAASAAARDKALQTSMEKLRSAFIGGTYGAGEETEVQKLVNKEVDDTILKHQPNVTQWMLYGDGKNPAAGVEHMRSVVAEYGYLPKQYKRFLEGQVDSGNGVAVAGMMLSLQGVRGPQGQLAGRKVLRDLSPRTRAQASFLLDLVEGGMGQETALTLLEKNEAKQIPYGRAAASYFPDEEGKPSLKVYVEKRDETMAATFGEMSSVVGSKLRMEVDKILPAYLAVYGEGRADKALEAAVSSIATVWQPHPLGLNGVLPAELTGLNLTPMELDLATGNYEKGKGFTRGGGFGLVDKNGQPRARLEIANDDSPSALGLGYYRIWYYDRDGNKVGPPRTVRLDPVVKLLVAAKGEYQKVLSQAAIAAAKKKRGSSADAVKRRNDISDRGPKY